MTAGRRLAACALAAAGGALAAGAAAAQDAPPPAVFGETVDVRVVNVEVVVTDGEGRRVPGLGRDDFRLTVDGEEVAIDYFLEVRAGVVAGGAGALPPGAAAGAPAGTSYLVYIDDLLSRQTDRDRALERLRDQLPHLEAADRMAVVAFDGRRLDMLSTWTGSAAELERVLAEAAARPAYGLFFQAERRAADRDRGLLPPNDPFDASRLGLGDLDYAERVAARLERAVAGATAALRAFARPPGRKVMLLVAGEWPFAVDRWVSGRNPVVNDPSVPTGQRLYGPLAESANLLGYTLYPADARGLDPERLTDRAGAGLPDPTAFGLGREELTHETFEYLARQTGGRAWLNERGGEALAETAADTRSYYWLGFTARSGGDDERHDIRVRTASRGLDVRSRDSFRDLSRRAEVSLAVESAVRFGDGGVPGARPLPGEFGRPARGKSRRMQVPLKVAIPLDLVTLVAAPGGGVAGRVELRVAALDEFGETNEVPMIEIDLRLPRRPEAGKYSLYETPVELRRAAQQLLVTVHDAASGEAAAFSATVLP